MNNKLNVKDLINVGIFSAIYFVMFFISGMTGFVPIFAVIFPAILSILGGIPFMLFLTKTRKFGMITIMGILMGILTFLMGQSWIAIITGFICGLLADWIYKAGKYASWKHILSSYCIFSLWVIGSMLPMWVMKDAFFAGVRAGQGAEFTDALLAYINSRVLLGIIVLTVLCAVAGAFLGRGILKKHFKRAGIV